MFAKQSSEKGSLDNYRAIEKTKRKRTEEMKLV